MKTIISFFVVLVLFFSITTGASSSCGATFETEFRSLNGGFKNNVIGHLVMHFLGLKPKTALTELNPSERSEFETMKSQVNTLIAKYGVSSRQALAVVPGNSEAPSRLSKKGFTDSQIGKMIELGMLAENRHKDYLTDGIGASRETIPIYEKKQLLREAGFTEKEIRRIPASLMRKGFIEEYGTIGMIMILFTLAVGHIAL